MFSFQNEQQIFTFLPFLVIVIFAGRIPSVTIILEKRKIAILGDGHCLCTFYVVKAQADVSGHAIAVWHLNLVYDSSKIDDLHSHIVRVQSVSEKEISNKMTC